jgi:signal transduction histidine kinase/ActR/RegA family two-component response regulator
MKFAPAVSIIVALVLLLTWLSWRAVNPEAELFDHALAEIDHFAVLENALYRDVFTARAGTLRNYDPLVHELNALHGSIDRLRETAAIDAETIAAVDRLAASVDRQEELVERFKSENALLHNSLAYFVRFGTRPTSPELAEAMSAAAAAMLQLTLDTSAAAAREVKDQLDELERQGGEANAGTSTEVLLAHGRLLHDLLPSVDSVLRAMHALPRKQYQDALRTLIMTREVASRMSARRYRRFLYGTSLLLVAFLVQLGLALKSRVNTLQRRAAFEHVIAGISMRFINARPQDTCAEIDRAVAELAACIGCDRAYFVVLGACERRNLWCRPGMEPPAGWPERAAELAARIGPTSDGVVHVPRVNWMPIGDERDTLTSLGLGGWACVTSRTRGGVAVALGFDAVGRPCRIHGPGELHLLRMALDTIVHGVTRQFMDRERTRLEAHLQRARRLERIGTFTSGIAHNFNNILGGILGHSEVMEERLGTDARLTRHLASIRRGAERARDLVDQILAFGRRRDARPRALNAHALITEAAALLNVSLPDDVALVIHEPAVAAIVSGEPAQLQQVILNLCNNAVQAMEGEGRVDVDMEVHDLPAARRFAHDELQPGRYACITINDTGRGMDEATLSRIFEPFFTTRSSGNGLGLATVIEIVREHNGAINVQSAPGKGSRFEVWLPCVANSEPAPELEARAVAAGRGETVLLVASDGTRLLRDEEMLAALGYEPVGFTTVAAALAACRAKPERFDVIVIGHLGSRSSSLELAAGLHAAAPHAPIVLATRSMEGIGADNLIGAGISDVVRWPIVAEEIAAALAHRSAPRESLARRVPMLAVGSSTR